jgi:hypothetical protein
MHRLDILTALLRHSGARRQGYVLILVLGLTTVITALGLAFINANGTTLTQAENRYRATRAQYASESGVAAAQHFLLYPPASVAEGDYWHGGNNLLIDGTADHFNVTVQQSATDTNRYTVSSTGVAFDGNGVTAVGKRRIVAEMLCPERPLYEVNHALLCSQGLTVPSNVTINGNVHANGAMNGSGVCNGAGSATLTLLWLTGTPPSPQSSLAPAVSIPNVTVAGCTTYSVQGTTYNARSYSSNSMEGSEATALNAIDMSATNPGRIIKPPAGDFTIKSGARLNGMLIVQGNLRIDGTGIQINAVSKYPALLVTGSISFHSDSVSAVITGPVRCNGFDQNGRQSCSLTINGCCITSSGFSSGSGNVFAFNWTLAGSRFWDFSRSGTLKPVTILSWKEG